MDPPKSLNVTTSQVDRAQNEKFDQKRTEVAIGYASNEIEGGKGYL